MPNLLLEENFSLARHTTIGCGGVAEACAHPRSVFEAAKLFRLLESENIPHFVLGAGANVLPSENNFAGTVVKLDKIDGSSLHGGLLVGAGTTGGALLAFARENALTGFEPFAGIPMTVGGAICMNAGVREKYFGETVQKVLAVERGKLRVFSQNDCKFGVKSSIFQENIVVLRALLKAGTDDKKAIRARERFFLERRLRLPKGRSMGCVFKNPPQISAGALIEACGLKGERMGGAVVSHVHANFILNEGGTASDVRSLIGHIKQIVKNKTGIELNEEVRYLPPF